MSRCRCGKKVKEEGYKSCKFCRDTSKRYYEKQKKRNRCPNCNTSVPDDKVYCRDCVLKITNEHKNKRYYRLKNQGLCVYCGKKEVSEDKPTDVFCDDCYEERVEYEMEKYGMRFFEYKHLKSLNETVSAMPEYLKEQFYKGLEDLSED